MLPVVSLTLGLLTASGLAQISAEHASDSMELVAGLDLGLHEPVTPHDYELAMHLLSMAMELDPQDANLARSVAQAAWSCADYEQVIAATRDIVRLDPSDTVAQLRLISAMINRAQTVDERVAAYERFVGEGAQSIDASVRSRLLLDKALLHREQGNETEFLSALRASAKLDSTNKEAQSLVAQHYSRVIDDPYVLMQLQLRVLYADPLDPHVHIAIARMCAAEGATDIAWRFLSNAITIFKIDSGVVPAQLQEQQLSLLWQHEGPQAILNKLNPSLADERATSKARIEARIAAHEPYDDIMKPHEIRYEPGIDRIRLMAASILEDQETVDSVLRDLEFSLIAYFGDIQAGMSQRGANRGALLGAYLGEVVSFQTMRAIVGVEEKEIEDDITRIIEGAPELEGFFRPFEPFSAFAGGRYQEALDAATGKLSRSGARDLLIAMCAERLGRTDDAINLYTELTRDYPLDATGSVARSRLEELKSGESLTTESGSKMQSLGNRIPAWFDQMITTPENTLTLSMRPVDVSFAHGERAEVEIKLKNLSTLPLSLGSAHPIDSNLLIVPGFRELETNFNGIGRSSVVDLGRRLRLNPLEELIIRVDPDSAQTRWLIHNQPQSVVRQRWRALQGFKPKFGGGLINSPFALTSETPIITRGVLAEATMSVEDLISSISDENSERIKKGVFGATAILLKPTTRPELTDTEINQIVDALWERYLSADTATRIWMLGTLPTRVAAPNMESFDERVRQQLISDSLIDTDISPPLVAMVLMTRVESAGSPAFDMAQMHTDPRLTIIANRIDERIRGIKPMYSGTDNPFEAFSLPEDDGLNY